MIEMKYIGYDSMKMLEKVWMAEIENRLPFQSKSMWMKTLAVQELIQPMEVTHLYPFKTTIEGWQLTNAGRFIYCDWASRREAYRSDAAPGQGEKK